MGKCVSARASVLFFFFFTPQSQNYQYKEQICNFESYLIAAVTVHSGAQQQQGFTCTVGQLFERPPRFLA